MISDSETEIVELTLKNLAPKFGNNKLKYDPHKITSKLRMQNNGSLKKSCARKKHSMHSIVSERAHRSPQVDLKIYRKY